ncbi:hypothetical protein ABZS88_43995 [Streptomyces sp. NPDC005480]|uniref:hypothetical protein n=1 Tax=Streptomyces sp. NPDC005480 TaxID=3154880 RepID=UPI00339E666C
MRLFDARRWWGQADGHVLTFGETMGLFCAADVGDLAEVADARISTGVRTTTLP